MDQQLRITDFQAVPPTRVVVFEDCFCAKCRMPMSVDANALCEFCRRPEPPKRYGLIARVQDMFGPRRELNSIIK